jgi:hypothetical protein
MSFTMQFPTATVKKNALYTIHDYFKFRLYENLTF